MADDSSSGPKVTFVNGGAAWKLALDPQDVNDTHYATGMEEGNAGTGWAHLQAFNVTKRITLLNTAKQAGDWLLSVAIKDSKGGLSWAEDMHPKSTGLIHPNLNNGGAGIMVFLNDLAIACKDIDPAAGKRFMAGAQAAKQSLQTTAVRDGNQTYWNDIDIRDDGSVHRFRNDPSWHWGKAGIVAALLRVSGSTFDMPGMQSSLVAVA